jgi:hypothetical protein
MSQESSQRDFATAVGWDKRGIASAGPPYCGLFASTFTMVAGGRKLALSHRSAASTPKWCVQWHPAWWQAGSSPYYTVQR